jgi:nucleotide-binding universal stress UspA family protein
MYKKILVPLDGSTTAEGVLPHAKALAYSEGAEIILLNVAANPAQSFAFEDPAIAGVTVTQEEERAGNYMEKICGQLKDDGFKVTSIIREGGAASMILKTSEDLGVDVIAMSTHGRSGIAHWLIGSTAERVVRHSKIPVMLIRPGTHS